MANLGMRPVLVGAVGEDFVNYRSWLERHGVDCDSILVSDTKHTARFVCTTDRDMAQIATFYSGAMSEARRIELGPIAARLGGADFVLIGANDPQAMLRHTRECRTRKIPFIADPSQQLAFSDGPEIKELIEGATYLITNEYEARLTEQKTGWTQADIAARVTHRVTTRGKDGVSIESPGVEPIHVGVAKVARLADPTGVGDAFRAGFLSGVYAAGVLLGAPLWGIVSDRVGRGRVLIIGLVGYVASSLLLLIPSIASEGAIAGLYALRGTTGFFSST